MKIFTIPLSSILICSVIFSCSLKENKILFEDSLDGTLVKGWNIPPESFVNHPDFGKAFYFKCDSIRLTSQVPYVGDESWKNYCVEFEILMDKEEGFIGLDYNIQDKKDYGCNFQFSTFRDTLNLQAMSMWGNNKGSWKLWPVSQNTISLPKNQWIKFSMEAGKGFANIYRDGRCIYTIYDLPFSSGGIRFWASYYGSAYFRNLKVTQLDASKIKPELIDIWKEVRNLNLIKTWQITELKPRSFAQSVLPDNLKNEKWIEAKTDQRGILNLSAIYPGYNQNTILAKTSIFSEKVKVIKCFLTYTDKFRLFCNGE